jgi:hypothetical protein
MDRHLRAQLIDQFGDDLLADGDGLGRRRQPDAGVGNDQASPVVSEGSQGNIDGT